MSNYVIDRVYKMFFLSHAFVYGVHWTLNQKSFKKLKVFFQKLRKFGFFQPCLEVLQFN